MSDLERERRERLFAVAVPWVAVAAIAGLSALTPAHAVASQAGYTPGDAITVKLGLR